MNSKRTLHREGREIGCEAGTAVGAARGEQGRRRRAKGGSGVFSVLLLLEDGRGEEGEQTVQLLRLGVDRRAGREPRVPPPQLGADQRRL